jgi:hypothetical protein
MTSWVTSGLTAGRFVSPLFPRHERRAVAEPSTNRSAAPRDHRPVTGATSATGRTQSRRRTTTSLDGASIRSQSRPLNRQDVLSVGCELPRHPEVNTPAIALKDQAASQGDH